MEYAKGSPDDLLIRISVHNRGPEAAELHVLPRLWFRNQWSWRNDSDRPTLRDVSPVPSGGVVEAVEPELGKHFLHVEGDAPLLFTENETNTRRIFGVENRSPYVKDSINDYVVHGRKEPVNPEKRGTKVAADFQRSVPAGASRVIRPRLNRAEPSSSAEGNGDPSGPFDSRFDEVFQSRRDPMSFMREGGTSAFRIRRRSRTAVCSAATQTNADPSGFR